MAATAKYKKTTTNVKGGGSKQKTSTAKEDKKLKVCPRCGKPL